MKEVILLGSGNSAEQCPFNAELWVTAAMLPYLDELDPSSTKVFCFGNDSNEAKGIASQLGIPIVSTEDYATEKFPLDGIFREFGVSYFKSATSYMIAYALYLGYDKIRLYGIDQGAEWHHILDKHFITFWLGVAKGRGVKAEITKSSGLYRVIKENVKDMYERQRLLKQAVKEKYKDFVDVANAKIDPYSFVSGLDLSAITVKHYSEKGELMAEWYHTT